MSAPLDALERLLAVSEQMARAAEEQEWEQLVALGEQHRVIAAALPADFAGRLPSAEKARARRVIERCRALDAATAERVAERQNSLRVLLREQTA